MGKLHYFLFSFQSAEYIGSVRLGWPDGKFVSEPRLAEAKKAANMPDDAVPIAVSYIGWMTPAQARGE